MENMEDIYLELYNYIIECLSKKEVTFLDEIKKLKNINIISKEEVRINQDNKLIYSPKVQKSTNISVSISRKITNKEMLLGTMEILKTYLVSLPSLEKRIVELLGQEYEDKISWVYEGGKDDEIFEMSQLKNSEAKESLQLIEEILMEVDKLG